MDAGILCSIDRSALFMFVVNVFFLRSTHGVSLLQNLSSPPLFHRMAKITRDTMPPLILPPSFPPSLPHPFLFLPTSLKYPPRKERGRGGSAQGLGGNGRGSIGRYIARFVDSIYVHTVHIRPLACTGKRNNWCDGQHCVQWSPLHHVEHNLLFPVFSE